MLFKAVKNYSAIKLKTHKCWIIWQHKKRGACIFTSFRKSHSLKSSFQKRKNNLNCEMRYKFNNEENNHHKKHKE